MRSSSTLNFPTVTRGVQRALLSVTVVAFCCAHALAACSDPIDPAAVSAITELTGPATAVSVARGFSTKTIVAIKRSSAFDGDVQLTAEDVPQGMLVSFAPATLSSTATLSEMTINALSTIAPGGHRGSNDPD